MHEKNILWIQGLILTYCSYRVLYRYGLILSVFLYIQKCIPFLKYSENNYYIAHIGYNTFYFLKGKKKKEEFLIKM